MVFTASLRLENLPSAIQWSISSKSSSGILTCTCVVAMTCKQKCLQEYKASHICRALISSVTKRLETNLSGRATVGVVWKDADQEVVVSPNCVADDALPVSESAGRHGVIMSGEPARLDFYPQAISLEVQHARGL